MLKASRKSFTVADFTFGLTLPQRWKCNNNSKQSHSIHHVLDNVLSNPLLHPEEILVSFLCRWGNWSTERLCHLMKFRQPPNGRARNWTQAIWLTAVSMLSFKAALNLWVLTCPLLPPVLRVLLFSYSPISLHKFICLECSSSIVFLWHKLLLILQDSMYWI